uniref:Kazal-like domain-containing protein n=1 Tax=Sarcophilus harrisii TaxID=9305 RepID=A0A7N4PZ94_SARHA
CSQAQNLLLLYFHLLLTAFHIHVIFQIDYREYEKPPLDEFPACTKEFIPICGSEGETYANKCIFCYAVKDSAKMVHDMGRFTGKI